MAEKPKILVVEDEEGFQNLYYQWLKGDYQIIQAWNIDEAFSLFDQHRRELVCIVLDGSLGAFTTVELARAIHSVYSGPVIAASSNGLLTQKLLDAGCTHHCTKDEVAVFVQEVTIIL